jgi:hypothetical protein
MDRLRKMHPVLLIAIAMAVTAAAIVGFFLAIPALTITGMSAILACGPNAFSVSQVSTATQAPGATPSTLPETTITYLEGRNVKNLFEQNKERYNAAEEAEGVPAAVMAALHYREAGMNPGSSISNGAPLGSGVNIDGINVTNNANQDAINMAGHFKRMAKYVYDIDVTSATMTTEQWGQAFLAYNRGFLYKRADRTYDQSPYVMNGFDADHLNMSWIDADTVSGVDGNKAGALAVMSYLGGAATSASSCSGSTNASGMVAPVVSEKLWVTSGFDFRVRFDGVRRNHNGIDIIGGSQIVAAMSGEVTLARYYGGYGYTVQIDHGNGIETLYGHMEKDSISVTVGQQVNAGDPIGIMGSTGDSSGDHLHFEYREDGVPLNPFPILEENGIDLTWTAYADPRNEKPGPQDN